VTAWHGRLNWTPEPSHQWPERRANKRRSPNTWLLKHVSALGCLARWWTSIASIHKLAWSLDHLSERMGDSYYASCYPSEVLDQRMEDASQDSCYPSRFLEYPRQLLMRTTVMLQSTRLIEPSACARLKRLKTVKSVGLLWWTRVLHE
jgi:hypothetical protein